MDEAPATRPVGRPPGPHDDTRAAVLPAALRVFLEEGGAALTPTRLHRESGVSRATIYRNWPDPADLVAEMLRMATRVPEDAGPTDDLRADLERAVDGLLWRFEERPLRAFFAACLEYGRRSDRVATASGALIDGVLTPFRLALAAAVDRGEVDGDIDELVLEVAGPLLTEHVLLGRAVSRDRGRAAVGAFLASRARAAA